MKKLILILCVCVALTLCFVACEDLFDKPDDGQSMNPISGGAPAEEDPTTEAPTTEAPTEETTTKEKIYKELTTDGEYGKLRYELVSFLFLKRGFVDPVLGSLGEQLERNNYWGNKATHIRLDPENYYYVCGYYDDPQERNDVLFAHVRDYTWIVVENENDIPEVYNGLSFVVAFQINETLSAIDISSKKEVSTKFEHYLMYTPEFVNGTNVADKLDADISYIYFLGEDDKHVIDSVEYYFHETFTLSCIELDGEWYLWYQVEKENIELEFGDYYDALIGVTREYDENHVVIKFDDFAKAVLVS